MLLTKKQRVCKDSNKKYANLKSSSNQSDKIKTLDNSKNNKAGFLLFFKQHVNGFIIFAIMIIIIIGIVYYISAPSIIANNLLGKARVSNTKTKQSVFDEFFDDEGNRQSYSYSETTYFTDSSGKTKKTTTKSGYDSSGQQYEKTYEEDIGYMQQNSCDAKQKSNHEYKPDLDSRQDSKQKQESNTNKNHEQESNQDNGHSHKTNTQQNKNENQQQNFGQHHQQYRRSNRGRNYFRQNQGPNFFGNTFSGFEEFIELNLDDLLFGRGGLFGNANAFRGGMFGNSGFFGGNMGGFFRQGAGDFFSSWARGGRYENPSINGGLTISDCLSELGINASDLKGKSNDELLKTIETAYKQLIRKEHPDKILNRTGLREGDEGYEEAYQKATNRGAKINAAKAFLVGESRDESKLNGIQSYLKYN